MSAVSGLPVIHARLLLDGLGGLGAGLWRLSCKWTCTQNTRCLQVFEIKPLRAWGAVATTLLSVAASLYLIAVSPWYLLPLAWAFAGTAWTGVSEH